MDRSQAFHLVIPSLPGHGLSGQLNDSWWTHGRIAKAFNELMARLGYQRYGVQGGDVGAFVASEMARLDSSRVIGVHVNALVTFLRAIRPSGRPSAAEQGVWRATSGSMGVGGYLHIQTLGHRLNLRPHRLPSRAARRIVEVQGMD
jgi:pimeloyl-ACP methyl ester carboxylesterase